MAENQIDPLLSSWVLDFLLRQPIQDQILIPLARALPISEHNFSLKKLFLIRKLESEVLNGTISEKLLEILHHIDELDKLLGVKDCSECLKRAFWGVAVECTVGCLRNSGNDVKGEFFDVVKRVWRGQVREMEGSGSGLVSEELLEWRGDIEAAVWEESVCFRVVERSKEVDAVEAVRVYLEEEKARMGPSFLELVVETLKPKEGVIWGSVSSRRRDDSDQCRINDGQESEYENNVEALKAKEGVISGSVCSRKRDDSDQCRINDGQESENDNNVETLKAKEGEIRGSICPRRRDDSDHCRINDGQESENDNNVRACDEGKAVVDDTEKGNSLSRRKHVARKRSRQVTSGCSRGAKLTNVDESGAGSSCKIRLLGTPEVERVQEALESSRLELHAVVKDPLPEALRQAESVKFVPSVANKDLEPLGGQNRGKSSVDNAQNAQSGEANVGVENKDFDNALDVQSGEENAGCSGQTNAMKSFMERNKSAHTVEWDDSIDGSPQELTESSSSSRPHLSSPRRRRVSPLNIYKERKVKRRRKLWSTAEEDALRAGVEKYGKGYWKMILNAYRDIFEERTEVDLKDKWRNLTRLN